MGSGDYCNPATVVVNTKTFFWDTKEIARNLFEGEQSLALRPENGDPLPRGKYRVCNGRLFGIIEPLTEAK